MSYPDKPMDLEMLKQFMVDHYVAIQKPYTIEELFHDVCRHLKLDHDRNFFEVNLAVTLDRKVKGIPVWLYCVAPSGGTKSAMANINRRRDGNDVYFIDKFTPNTLVSGKIEVDESGNPKPVKGILVYVMLM